MKLILSIRRSRQTTAFSLLEILVVIAIVGIVATIAIPMLLGVMQSSKLRNAANLVVDQLALARQTALSRNCRVEVRFYELEDTNGGGGLAYRALRTCLVTDTGIVTPLSKLKMLPSSVVIPDKADENTISRNDSAYSGTEDLPQASKVHYFKFSFLPNGRTDFDPGGNWFMTLYQQKYLNHPNGQLPPNYVILQIDDFTGSSHLYRP